MPSTPLLPFEIEEAIFDFLAEDDNNRSALKTCSLVCQAFLPICRKHIFGSIALGDCDGPLPTPHALGRLLSERPEIENYIRKLDYDIQAHLIDPSIPESLSRISRLESLTVRNCNGTETWRNHPIRPTLLHLLYLPTLTHFKMNRINDFVVWDLMPCVNLKHLDLGHYTICPTETTLPATFPAHPIQLNEFEAGTGSATAIMKLCTARRPDGQSLIDFGSLTKITVNLETPSDVEASQELFRRCEMLAGVFIIFCNPRKVKPSLTDMLRPTMQTLKHIVVLVYIYDVNDAPLFGIPSEFEDMRTAQNIIESVTIEVIVGRYGNCSQGEDWGRLDEVLTSPGWFALKRVSLIIYIIPRGWDSDYDLKRKGALQDLPETQFPQLSTSNHVSFQFKLDIFVGLRQG